MIDFVPWMILSTVVILIVAAWGAVRGGLLEPGGRAGMVRLPDAESAFAECFAEHGIPAPALRVFRDPDGDGLLIVGPDHLDDRTRAVLADCDRRLAPRFSAPG